MTLYRLPNGDLTFDEGVEGAVKLDIPEGCSVRITPYTLEVLTPGNSQYLKVSQAMNGDLPLWIHSCGTVAAFMKGDIQGDYCDVCQSDEGNWQPLYIKDSA
jgi:hypothetical protein